MGIRSSRKALLLIAFLALLHGTRRGGAAAGRRAALPAVLIAPLPAMPTPPLLPLAGMSLLSASF